MGVKKSIQNNSINEKENDRDSLTLSLHRTEALFDGILAIAMTLLVLDIKIPNPEGILTSADFLQTLGEMHLTFIKYFTSFFILASIWIANNKEMHYLEKTDNTHMWLNLYCMFFIVLIPFTTSVQDDFSSIPLAIVLFHLNIFFVELFILIRWLYIKRHKALIKVDVTKEALLKRQISISFTLMVIPLIALASTFIIDEYSNLLYFLFFFAKRKK